MYEIKDQNGKVLARSKFFGVLKTECDNLAKQKGTAPAIFEVQTIKTEHIVYMPLSHIHASNNSH